jgi:molybdate transport system permease protein
VASAPSEFVQGTGGAPPRGVGLALGKPLRWTAAAITGIAVAVLLTFVGLPLVAIFQHVPLSALLAQLHSSVALQALFISLKTSLTALLFIVVVGTPVAHLLGTKRFVGRNLLVTLFELPLVLPPVVAGIGLFVAFGRFGLLGSHLERFGISLPFTWVAVVMAQAFVAMPFYVRQGIAAFSSLDFQLTAASRTLGAGPARTFVRVAVPLARQSLLAGAALAWARALGEFGATALFAGNLQGVTQTLPLAIYDQFNSADLTACLAMSALLIAVSFAVLITVKLMLRSRSWV